jgi:hypothetical protein
MDNFFKKHVTWIKTAALILMLVIPFLLYAAASNNSPGLVNLFLVLMSANMLFTMLKG